MAATDYIIATGGNGKVTVKWNAVSGATQYRLRRNDGTGWVNYKELTTTSYVDTAVTNGTTYRYAVYARVGGAWGEASAIVMATPSSAANGPVLYCNEGGTRYVQEIVTVNEGGTEYEFENIKSNEGGTRYEIYRRFGLEVTGLNLTETDSLMYDNADTPPASIDLYAVDNDEAVANIAIQGLQEGDAVEITLTYYRDAPSWYVSLTGYGWSNITSDLEYSFRVEDDPTSYIDLYEDVSDKQYSLAFTATSDEVGLNINILRTYATRVILYIHSIKVNGEERLFY